MNIKKDSKKKKVVDVVSSIYATSGFLKDVVVKCHVDKIQSNNKCDISKNLPETVSPEEQEQHVITVIQPKVATKIIKKKHVEVSASRKPIHKDTNTSKKVAEHKLPQAIKYQVPDDIFKDQRKPYIPSKYVDLALQDTCPHYNTPRESLSQIFKKHNKNIYDKDKYMDNPQIQPNLAELRVPTIVNDIRREIETWEHSMLNEKHPEMDPQSAERTRDNNVPKSQNSTVDRHGISVEDIVPVAERNADESVGNLNVAQSIERKSSTPWEGDRGCHDRLLFPKRMDDVLSPPDAVLEHAEHLLLATRLQLSQLSSCLHDIETPTVINDRQKKSDSADDRKKLCADKAVLNCPTTLKPKELQSQPQDVHHKKHQNKNHMPGCRYHKDSFHKQMQLEDQGQIHHKDPVYKMTTQSHLQWQSLPSVNIKQNFQIQQGPTVSVPSSSHKPYTQFNRNVKVIETVHNSYEDKCNEKFNQFSSKSETNSIPSASTQLTLNSKTNKMDDIRRNYDKTYFDTKLQDTETEYSSYGNKESPISRNEFNRNKNESKTKLKIVVTNTECDSTFSSYNSKCMKKPSQKVHNNTLSNHQIQNVKKTVTLKHKKWPGGSKILPKQSSKQIKKKPVVSKPFYPSQRTPKASVHQINDSLLHQSMFLNSTPSKESNFESDDTLLSNKTQKSHVELSNIIPNSISNAGHEKDLLIHTTPQDSPFIYTNSEIEQSNQISQSPLLRVQELQNEWHTQVNTIDTHPAEYNNDANMNELELSVFNAISSEVLSGLLHNVQGSSQNSRKKLDLEVHQTFMVENLQSNYSSDECCSEDRSVSKNNDSDQSYDDDFEDEDDRQNKDKCNEIESSGMVTRNVLTQSDNSEPINKNEISEEEIINISVVKNNPELIHKSSSLSPKQISIMSSSLRSSSPPSLSKEQSTHYIPEETVKNQVISHEDFSHSATQNLEPNLIKTPVPTLTKECSLGTEPVSSCSFSYFPLDFYTSLQPHVAENKTISQNFDSKESQENTNNVSSFESDLSSTSQTELNLTESLSLGEIAPSAYPFPSLFNFQKMDLNLSESLSSGEINPKVSQIQPFYLHNKNQSQSEGGISLKNYRHSRIFAENSNKSYQVKCKKIIRNDLLEESPYRSTIERSEGELSDCLDIFNISHSGSSSLSHQK